VALAAGILFTSFKELRACSDLLAQTNHPDEFPPQLSGIGQRGLLTSIPPFSPANFAATLRKGILEWTVEIYIASSLEEAKAHDEREPNLLDRGFYLIGAADLADVKPHEVEDMFNLLRRGGLFYFLAGAPQRIPDDFIATRFSTNPDRLSISTNKKGRGTAFFLRGWFYPKFRGVLHIEDTVGSATYKGIRNVARRYERDGFQVKFNTDFEQALNLLALQERKGQELSTSRFLDADVKNAMRILHSQGQALFAEMWSKEGQMTAGALIIKSGNTFMVDSVFYPKDGIDHAKVLSLAVTLRLFKAGVLWQDYQTVSGFSAPLKVRLIPVANFEAMRRGMLPTNPDFFSPWTPAEFNGVTVPQGSVSFQTMGAPLSVLTPGSK